MGNSLAVSPSCLASEHRKPNKAAKQVAALVQIATCSNQADPFARRGLDAGRIETVWIEEHRRRVYGKLRPRRQAMLNRLRCGSAQPGSKLQLHLELGQAVLEDLG